MPRARTRVAKGPLNGVPDGGAHLHKLVRDFEAGLVSTFSIDGRHTHLFLLPTGEVVSTSGGAHVHSAKSSPGHEHLYGGEHDHVIEISGVEFRTYDDGWHEHATQVEATALDGPHGHWIEVGDQYIYSLTPQQIALMVGLGVGEMDDILGSLRTGLQPAVKVAHGNATELRTPLWTLTESGDSVHLTRGWRPSAESKAVWAGYVHTTLSTDSQVELWLTDRGEHTAERIELTKNEDKWTSTKGGPPIVLQGGNRRVEGDAQLPEVVKNAVPKKAQYWAMESDSEADGARNWLTRTKWWDRYEKGERCEGDVADYVKSVIPAQVQSPMANDGVIEKAGGLVFLHECGDPDLVRKALETDHLILATRGTDAEECLLRVSEQVGKTVQSSRDDRTAGLAIATSLDLDLMASESHAYYYERESIRDALVARVAKTNLEETPDEKLWLEDAKRLLDLGKAWGPTELGLAARLLVQKPFAGYETFDDCVKDQESQGHDGDSSRSICGRLQADVETQKATEFHPENWRSTAARDLPVVDMAWDPIAASKRVLEWASVDTYAGRPDEARVAFLAYDDSATTLERGYKLPFTDVVEGKLVAVLSSFASAEAALPGSNLPPDVQTSAQEAIDSYKARIAQKLPESSEWEAQPDPVDQAIEEALDKADTRLMRNVQKSSDEERFVYGVVMEPLETDTQGDTQTAKTIRDSAHEYMATYKNIGLQHKLYINDSVSILESYIAPMDFTTKDGAFVKEGSWLMGVRVIDDKIWDSVKSGKITGFSIGGRGIRAPIALD